VEEDRVPDIVMDQVKRVGDASEEYEHTIRHELDAPLEGQQEIADHQQDRHKLRHTVLKSQQQETSIPLRTS